MQKISHFCPYARAKDTHLKSKQRISSSFLPAAKSLLPQGANFTLVTPPDCPSNRNWKLPEFNENKPILRREEKDGERPLVGKGKIGGVFRACRCKVIK